MPDPTAGSSGAGLCPGGSHLLTPQGLILMPAGSRSCAGCLAPVLHGRHPVVPDSHVVLLRQPPALSQVGRVWARAAGLPGSPRGATGMMKNLGSNEGPVELLRARWGQAAQTPCSAPGRRSPSTASAEVPNALLHPPQPHSTQHLTSHPVPSHSILQHRCREEFGAASFRALVAGLAELQLSRSWLRSWWQSTPLGGSLGSPMPCPRSALPSRSRWDIPPQDSAKLLWTPCVFCSHHTPGFAPQSPCSSPALLPPCPALAPAVCFSAVTNLWICFTLYFYEDRDLNSRCSKSPWSPAEEILVPIHHRRVGCQAFQAQASRGLAPSMPALSFLLAALAVPDP